MRLSRGLPIADDVLRSPLGHAISGATAIDPSQRFASAAQMRAAIDGVAHQLSQGTFETTVKSAGTVTGGAPTVAPVAVTMGSPLAGAPPRFGPLRPQPSSVVRERGGIGGPMRLHRGRQLIHWADSMSDCETVVRIWIAPAETESRRFSTQAPVARRVAATSRRRG